jgi:hypothetical protein
MKYGIMLYKETDNIGDDIQTYTAKRFLPHIDYYIDREDLNCFVPTEKEYVSVIMNGWFMHNKSAWPPTPYINPLLISMHFTCLDKVDVGEKYLQGLGGEYLKQYQPIGCRDIETGKRLTRNGIENYFTGCMTLTLQPFDNIEKQDYICLVDLDEASANLVKENTKREIKEITHTVNPEEIKNKTFEERMKAVEDLLKTYQGAHLVLTNRLHVALPCLALGTPVILIHKENFEYDRLGTYLKYMKSFTNVEFANINVEDIIENPEKNSDEFLEIRNNLIKQCEDFVKKCDTEDFNIDNLPDVELYKEYTKRLKWYQQLNEDIRIKAKKNIYESEKRYIEYENMIKQNNEEWKHRYEELENQYSKLQGEFQQKNKELTSVYKSKGWKLLEKIRKLKIKKA